jgi:hypothetical protein
MLTGGEDAIQLVLMERADEFIMTARKSRLHMTIPFDFEFPVSLNLTFSGARMY